MAIKRIQTVTYVTDRGIELLVSDMDTTHLLNAIGHHQKQIEVLRSLCCGNQEFDKNFLDRIALLTDTIGILAYELQNRPVKEDDNE